MRLLVVAGGLAAAVILFLLLRPGDEEATTPPPPTTAPAPPPAPTSTPAPTGSNPAGTTPPLPPPPPRPAKPDVVSIRITIRDGRPVGGVRRATVKKGRRVRLVVRSDVADHVHLHGYDLFRDVAPGKPAQLALRATIAGRFEIELEDRGLQIAELEVRP